MREYLIFRLYGMMASWGDIAVGEFRPTFDRPSKSAIIGMIAAACGIQRDDEEQLNDLATGYSMAIRIDSPGVLLRDYHTAQVPPSKKGKQKMSFPTRKDELSVPQDDLNTVLSTRDYRCDAHYTICMWSRTSAPPYSLNELKMHLENPVFQLYLGRKSCPLSLPLHPHIVHTDSLSDAFSKAGFPDNQLLNDLYLSRNIRIYWEDDDNTGYEIIHTVQRRDNPLSRRRWQFGNRNERYTMIQKSPGSG